MYAFFFPVIPLRHPPGPSTLPPPPGRPSLPLGFWNKKAKRPAPSRRLGLPLPLPRAENRGPPTTHHPHKRSSASGGIFGGVVCEFSETKKKGKMHTTPSFALAMLIVNFVGVVRGFRGPKKKNIRNVHRVFSGTDCISARKLNAP